MNNEFEDSGPLQTSFAAPDLSGLDERSRQLLDRSRAIHITINENARRLQNAIELSDKLMRNQRFLSGKFK